jgi:hypothetical protein
MYFVLTCCGSGSMRGSLHSQADDGLAGRFDCTAADWETALSRLCVAH